MNFEALTKYLDSLQTQGVPGCDVAVYVSHEPVYRHQSGEAAPGRPMTGNETYWFYSASKVICMTAAMQLVEQGRIHLDDPVSKYLPAYAQLTVADETGVRPAKTVMTIEHLMTMQGGLNYDLESPAIRECLQKYGRSATTRQLAEAFVAQPLDFDPGTRFQYSLCHDVMAAVIEVASGMTYGEYLKKNLFDPLGVRHLTFRPAQDELDRLAARYVWDDQERPIEQERFSLPYRISDNHESGGAGLMGDVDSYILIADALANDGEGRTGAKILSRESIDLMRKPHLSGQSAIDFDVRCDKVGYTYGLGVRTLCRPETSRGPVGEFGWDSAAGAWVMVDVENHIAAFYAQHILNCGRCYNGIHPVIRDHIYEGLKR